MIHDPALETLGREQLAELQRERLRAVAAYVYDRIGLYRERFDDAGVGPDQIRSLDDLRRLPFTRKDDLRDHYPFGLFAVPREDVVRIHGSSGTTGKPTVVGYTRADLEVFAEVNARSLAMLGAEPGMMLHNAFGYGLFTGGLGLHYGAERLGMTVVPVSGGMTERQLLLITDFRPDVIACTPSYALTLAQEFEQRGIGPDEISLRFAVVGAEPWTEAMRAEIDRGLGVRSSNVYGLSEVIGPGVSCECVEERNGSHVHEDHFLPEVVDPESGEPLPEGEVGVLVFTALTKQALPLIRYWTGDLASLSSEPCSCGRTLVRMSRDPRPDRRHADHPRRQRLPEPGREGARACARARTALPARGQPGGHDGRARGANRGDRARSSAPSASTCCPTRRSRPTRPSRELRGRVSGLIKDTIGCTMKVTIVAPGTVPRSEGGKLSRVLDTRCRG